MSTLRTTTTTPTWADAPRNSLRTIASIVGWLFVVTYVTSIAAKVALLPAAVRRATTSPVPGRTPESSGARSPRPS